MGRYIEHEGKRIYKYLFGKQEGQLHLLADEYGIGEYRVEYEEIDTGIDGIVDKRENKYWLCNHNNIDKLKELYSKCMNGRNPEELHSIGKQSVLKFMENQDKAWQGYFHEAKLKIEQSAAFYELPFLHHHSQDREFDLYSIYAKAVCKQTQCDFGLIMMIHSIINHMKEYTEGEQFIFRDEAE